MSAEYNVLIISNANDCEPIIENFLQHSQRCELKIEEKPEVTAELYQQEKTYNRRSHFLTLPVGNLKSDGYDIIWKQSRINAVVVFLDKKDTFKVFQTIYSHLQLNMPEVLQANLTLIGYKSLSDHFYRNVKDKLKASQQGIVTKWISDTLVGYNCSLPKQMEGSLWNFVLQNWEPLESINVTASYYHAYTLTWAQCVFEFLTELYYLLDINRLQILPKHADNMLHLNSFKFVYYLTCCTSASHCNSKKICFDYTTNDFFKTQYCYVCGCKSTEHTYILFPKRGGEMKNFVRFYKTITDSSTAATIRNEKKEIVHCLASLTKLCKEMNWFENDPNLNILKKFTEKNPLQIELAKFYNNELENSGCQDSKSTVLKIIDMLPQMKLTGWYVDEIALGMFKVWLEKSNYLFYGKENKRITHNTDNYLKADSSTSKNTDGLCTMNRQYKECIDNARLIKSMQETLHGCRHEMKNMRQLQKQQAVDILNDVEKITDKINQLEDTMTEVKDSVVQINNNIIAWSKN